MLNDPNAKENGIDESIFVDPRHLHLTLVMLKLYSDEARYIAAQVWKHTNASTAKPTDYERSKKLILATICMSRRPDTPFSFRTCSGTFCMRSRSLPFSRSISATDFLLLLLATLDW